MTVPRRGLIAVLLGVLLVTASAVSFRLSTDDSDYQLVRGTFAELTPYDQGLALVDQIQVGTTLNREGGAVLSTSGMFVAVRVTLQATGSEPVRWAQARMVSTTATFGCVSQSDSVTADPGFEVARQFVFEVDPLQLSDLTVQGADIGIVNGYYQKLSVHLGITRGNAAAWAGAAQGRAIDIVVDETTKGLP